MALNLHWQHQLKIYNKTASTQNNRLIPYTKEKMKSLEVKGNKRKLLLFCIDLCLLVHELFTTDVCIKHFLRVYRESFPNANITPKLHMLEDHLMEQLCRFKVGLGLLNEQGGELVHTEFNRAGRAVYGMRDELQKLMSIMRRHLTMTFLEVHW